MGRAHSCDVLLCPRWPPVLSELKAFLPISPGQRPHPHRVPDRRGFSFLVQRQSVLTAFQQLLPRGQAALCVGGPRRPCCAVRAGVGRLGRPPRPPAGTVTWGLARFLAQIPFCGGDDSGLCTLVSIKKLHSFE